MEYFDVYDDNFNPIGQASRLETHTQGLWHNTFQCWIYREVEGMNYFIVQRRHPDKEAFPNKLDKSSAGHLMAGETVADGVREIEEELGLIVPFDDLFACGIVKQQHIEPHWIDREICHLFLLQNNQPLDRYTLQKEEVTGIFQVQIPSFFDLMDDKIQQVNVSGLEWDAQTESYISVHFLAKKDDFTPQTDEYFTKLKAAIAYKIENRR
jgi:isopentenyldiphosphate isomerase